MDRHRAIQDILYRRMPPGRLQFGYAITDAEPRSIYAEMCGWYRRWMPEPSRDRPQIPDGYGLPETDQGLLEWGAVEDRLRSSSSYWMATTRTDGRPHVIPRWGVWTGGRFWYDGAVDTVHVKNLDENNRCVLHLEDGRQAVIVEGRSGAADPPGLELGGQLSELFTAKYGKLGYSPSPNSWEGLDAGGLRVFTPVKAMAWFDFPSDVTRFRFEQS